MRTDDLAADLDRLVDRLRHLPDTRLARPPRGTTPAVTAAPGPGEPIPGGPIPGNVADLARELAQRLADTARGIEGRGLARPPDPRRVPRLGDLASGDLVAVTGTDVLLAARHVRDDEPVWVDGIRRPAAEAVATARSAVTTLRSVL